MTDEQVEKIIKSNMILQMNLAGIRADFEEALQRTWVGLTDDDKVLIKHDANYNQFMTAGEYADRVQQLTEARLKDKNT